MGNGASYVSLKKRGWTFETEMNGGIYCFIIIKNKIIVEAVVSKRGKIMMIDSSIFNKYEETNDFKKIWNRLRKKGRVIGHCPKNTPKECWHYIDD